MIDRQLRRAQVEHLYASVPRGLLFTLLITPAVAYLLRDQVPLQLTLLWCALVVGAFIVRLIWYLRYRAAQARHSVGFWHWAFRLAVAITGFAWGTMPWLLFSHCDPFTQMGMTAIFVIAPVVVIFSAVSDLHTAAIYGGAVYPSISAWWATQPGDGPVYTLLSIFCGIIVIALARRSNRTTMEYLRQKYQIQHALEAAESANRAKSDFLASMSHELRTPLNAIIGFSEMISTEALGPVAPARYREYADGIHASGQHLLSLINDVLDLSKIEAGKYEFIETETNLTEIIARCVDIMHEQARKNSVTIKTDIAPIPALMGDQRALMQIMLNLLSNSTKFAPEGGYIQIAAKAGPDGGIDVVVEDDGPGIPENKRARALAPFEQLSGSPEVARDQSQPKGTGLGLAIANRLMEQHEGTLEIGTSETGGASITLHFPAERVKQLPPAQEPAAA